MYFIDSHCHLDILTYISKYNIDYILFKSKINNVKYFLNISLKLKDSYKAWNKFKLNKNIFYSCGIHPLNTIKEKYKLKDLIYFSSKDYVVAIGETGLDYLKINNNYEKIIQQESLIKHINVSNYLNKPIIIHSRNSYCDVLNIIKNENLNLPGIWHCFNGDIYLLKKILNNNFYISFSGLITFNSNFNYIKDVIKFIPLNKILIETDSPYLSPEPYRGKINYPFYLNKIIKFISNIKLKSINNISKEINNNFFKIIKYNNFINN